MMVRRRAPESWRTSSCDSSNRAANALTLETHTTDSTPLFSPQLRRGVAWSVLFNNARRSSQRKQQQQSFPPSPPPSLHTSSHHTCGQESVRNQPHRHHPCLPISWAGARAPSLTFARVLINNAPARIRRAPSARSVINQGIGHTSARQRLDPTKSGRAGPPF
jgi:hypothetical protein